MTVNLSELHEAGMHLVGDPEFLNEDADGNRVLSSDDNDFDPTPIVTTEKPFCPTCDTEYGIYCAECGEDYLACMCDPDSSPTIEFWCVGCDNTFRWDPNYIVDESLWADELDDVVVELVADPETTHPGCICEPQKAFVCGICNAQRDTPDGAWRTFIEDSQIVSVLQDGDDSDESDEQNNKPAVPTCDCTPQPKYYCALHGVSRRTPESPWQSLSGSQLGQLANAKKTGEAQKATEAKKTTAPAKKATTSSGFSTGYYGGYYGKCRHYGVKLTFPSGVSVLPSSMNNTRDAQAPAPDFGLYLDWGWKPAWRAEFIAWPDFGLPTNYEAAVDAIIDMYERAKKGWRVEVGCIGGHGRTGTALACMGVLDGMEPKAAIKYVRSEYCIETLENAKQEWWVEWFDAYVNLKPLPEMPKYTSSHSTTTYKSTTGATSGTICTLKEHYVIWYKGGKSCSKGTKCSYWSKDTERFEKGDIPDACRELDAELEASIKVVPLVVREGYFIPKPSRDAQHTPAAKQGCKCDFCRYTVRHGAFLDKVEKPTQIHIACKGGEIVPVSIDNTKFRPMPPSADGGHEGVRHGEYVWYDQYGWVWTKLNEGSTSEKDAAVERLADAIEPDADDDNDVDPTKQPTLSKSAQEPEELVSSETLRLVTVGLRSKLHGVEPGTYDIRKALVEYDAEQWRDLMDRAKKADDWNATVERCGESKTQYYCLTCKDWSDHSTVKHIDAQTEVDTAQKATDEANDLVVAETPEVAETTAVFCFSCRAAVYDHTSETCPRLVEVSDVSDDEKRNRKKKLNKRTKGGKKRGLSFKNKKK